MRSHHVHLRWKWFLDPLDFSEEDHTKVFARSASTGFGRNTKVQQDARVARTRQLLFRIFYIRHRVMFDVHRIQDVHDVLNDAQIIFNNQELHFPHPELKNL
jgi:hypothetical protein